MKSLLPLKGTLVSKVSAGSLIWIPVKWYSYYAIICRDVTAKHINCATFLSSAGDGHSGQLREIPDDSYCLDFGRDFIFCPKLTSACVDKVQPYSEPGIALLDGDSTYIVIRGHHEDETAQMMNLSTGEVGPVPDHQVIKFQEWSVSIQDDCIFF